MFQVAEGKLPAVFLVEYLPFYLLLTMKVVSKIYSINKLKIATKSQKRRICGKMDCGIKEAKSKVTN
ncbi:MAG: hypothetical protein GYA35_10615 [Thermoanaerobaculaceae bacterium]|nr:hypothetical protein [Thermoanaerobaculaceae bacterium]